MANIRGQIKRWILQVYPVKVWLKNTHAFTIHFLATDLITRFRPIRFLTSKYVFLCIFPFVSSKYAWIFGLSKMLKKLIRKASVKTMQKEMDIYLRNLQVGTEEEVSFLLASTAVAIKFLKISKYISKPFPEDIFLGLTICDDQPPGLIASYNIELIALHKQVSKSEDFNKQILASGLMVLIHSLRALSVNELFATGRLCWIELMRGMPFYLESMSDICPNYSEAEAMELLPVPNMLSPGPVK
ncbi:hypothetical protein [Endozoicomonas euniceicola]|uniref:Uncharacterized protein n=1 Tax=Endozoicomonas euniceicola TaxID=1234143 RepID=A0ABY6GU57_9GAMM|nr:hypothetical protein [Endozoicomonas euniceicola]UYM16295.1 hypothetical protein NX720_26455 [Endozoicomonas euniceicola]